MKLQNREVSMANGHHANWFDCIRQRTVPSTPEELGHRAASLGHLVIIAHHVRRSLTWDPAKEAFVGDEQANRMRARAVREPWGETWATTEDNMMKAYRMELEPAARVHGILWVCLAAVALLPAGPTPPEADSKPEVSPEEQLKIEQAIPATGPGVAQESPQAVGLHLECRLRGPPVDPARQSGVYSHGQEDRRFRDGGESRSGDLPAARVSKQFDAVFLNNTRGEPVHRRGTAAEPDGIRHWRWRAFGDPWHRRSFHQVGSGRAGRLARVRLDARRTGANHRISTEHVFIKLDDPGHPVNRAFGGQGFDFRDEFFRFHEVYSRDRVRVLLSIDTAKTDMRQGQFSDKIDRPDNDYALAWVRSHGKGRVFYSTIGHNPYVFWDKRMLEFYLAAIQFALGDLEAPTAPSHAAPHGDAPGGQPKQS